MSTIVVAAAVVRDGDRFLLTKRPDKGHLAGFWEFPGGKVEAGERSAGSTWCRSTSST
jgi:8-oxo-dGTP pyrophosphatase MutT (NUDIX family)